MSEVKAWKERNPAVHQLATKHILCCNFECVLDIIDSKWDTIFIKPYLYILHFAVPSNDASEVLLSWISKILLIHCDVEWRKMLHYAYPDHFTDVHTSNFSSKKGNNCLLVTGTSNSLTFIDVLTKLNFYFSLPTLNIQTTH